MDRDTITIPAPEGEWAEVRVQGFQIRAAATADGASVTLPPLFFGNRAEIRGAVWVGKAMTKLMVERR